MFNAIEQHKQQDLDLFVRGLNDLGNWLLSLPQKQMTLSVIAERIVQIFSMEYCSIHIYKTGRWHNLAGTCVRDSSQTAADSLKVIEDHPLGTLELAEEQSLDVRNFPIRTGYGLLALLVVKSRSLKNESISVIASMIGLLLVGTLQDFPEPARKYS